MARLDPPRATNVRATLQSGEGRKTRANQTAGSIWYVEREGELYELDFSCPCGCGTFAAAPLKSYSGVTQVYTLTGPEEAPTVSPWVVVMPEPDGNTGRGRDRRDLGGFHWVGELTNGVFIQHDSSGLMPVF